MTPPPKRQRNIPEKCMIFHFIFHLLHFARYTLKRFCILLQPEILLFRKKLLQKTYFPSANKTNSFIKSSNMFCHNSHLFVMRNGYSSYELGVCNHYVYFNSKKKKVSSLFITKYFRRFSFRKHPPFRKKKLYLRDEGVGSNQWKSMSQIRELTFMSTSSWSTHYSSLISC